MSKMRVLLFAATCATSLQADATARQPDRKPGDGPAKEKKDYSRSSIVTRMMAFDKNNDGKLTRDEITDERLLRLFDQADTNKDGVVTKEELIALAEKLEAESAGGRGGPGGSGGRGPGGFGRPPRPGQILPPFVQERLNLTDEQKKRLGELQKEVDGKLGAILTDEQRKQLKEMEAGPGPGGPGGRGGPGGGGRGPGGPGGRGPGGDGGRPPDRQD